MSDTADTNSREQEARIRQSQADVMLKVLDSVKRTQDIGCAPLTLVGIGIGATAALFGAAIAFLKWVG